MVIDTTPVLPVTDAIVVSRFADATILVVNAGDTTRNQLHQSLARWSRPPPDHRPGAQPGLERRPLRRLRVRLRVRVRRTAPPEGLERQRSGGAPSLPAGDEGSPISVR